MSEMMPLIVFYLVTTVVKFVVLIFGLVLPLAALLTWMERRQSAYSQDRLGPWRAHFFTFRGRPVGAGGLLHVIADAIKMFFKEPFAPRTADPMVYHLAPMVGFITALLVVAMLPFGPDIHTGWAAPWDVIPMQLVRLDAGLLWTLALGSLGVYGAALAGWSSNNRFALLGGLRASAQSISYEIALGLTLVGVLIVAGTTEPAAIVAQQRGNLFFGLLPAWGIVVQPLAAVLFLVAAIAETKRAPFDLPEGESEIIGYFVEYSSMGFGLFMLGEFIEVVVLAAMFTTLFLGGWQMPWLLGGETLWLGFTVVSIGPWLRGALGMGIFASKVFFLCALQLQIRWTLPRFRYDQLMHLGWKILLPLALGNIFWTALLVAWDPSFEYLSRASMALVGAFVLVVVAGPPRPQPRLATKEAIA